MHFRKKPVVIEAVRWTGENFAEVDAFAPAAGCSEIQRVDWGGNAPPINGLTTPGYPRLLVKTLEGWLWGDRGDWIIRGVRGEFYPCKPDIFKATYEPESRAATSGVTPRENLIVGCERPQPHTHIPDSVKCVPTSGDKVTGERTCWECEREDYNYRCPTHKEMSPVPEESGLRAENERLNELVCDLAYERDTLKGLREAAARVLGGLDIFLPRVAAFLDMRDPLGAIDRLDASTVRYSLGQTKRQAKELEAALAQDAPADTVDIVDHDYLPTQVTGGVGPDRCAYVVKRCEGVEARHAKREGR